MSQEKEWKGDSKIHIRYSMIYHINDLLARLKDEPKENTKAIAEIKKLALFFYNYLRELSNKPKVTSFEGIDTTWMNEKDPRWLHA